MPAFLKVESFATSSPIASSAPRTALQASPSRPRALLATLAGPARSRCERVRATEYAPRDPFRLLERLHASWRSSSVASVLFVECLRVTPLSS